jgi:hypothetical protein
MQALYQTLMALQYFGYPGYALWVCLLPKAFEAFGFPIF